MDVKGGSGQPLNRHPCAGLAKNGSMCNPYIICCVSSTSALPEKVTFSLQGHPKRKEKSGLRPRSRKLPEGRATGSKSGAEGCHGGGPKGGPGLAAKCKNGAKMAQSDVQESLEIRLVSKGGPKWLRWPLEGAS